MRLLFYISTICGGGAARVMTNLANSLIEKNDVIFVTNFFDVHEYHLENSIVRYTLEKKNFSDNKIVKNKIRINNLRKIIKKEKPDICISFMKENNYRLIVASRKLPTKIIVSVRNDPKIIFKNHVSKLFGELFYRCADCVVFQTDDAKTFFSKQIQKKSQVILNPVDDVFFQKIDFLGKNIIACGRLSKQKNYKMMLAAFKLVLKKFPMEILAIYGEGYLLNELKEYAQHLEINNQVKFMGYCSDMASVYKNGKFLIMSSDYEGLPNVLLEALASSLPVVSTNCPCGGPQMIIENGINGYLTETGNEVLFSEAICKLLENENNLKKMKTEAYYMAKKYSKSTIVKKWEKLLLTLTDDNCRLRK